MADLRSTLRALGRGDVSLQAVVKALVLLVKNDSSKAARVLQLVESAHRHHEISNDHFEQLRALLGALDTSDASANHPQSVPESPSSAPPDALPGPPVSTEDDAHDHTLASDLRVQRSSGYQDAESASAAEISSISIDLSNSRRGDGQRTGTGRPPTRDNGAPGSDRPPRHREIGVGTLLDDRYALDRLVGRGGMGVVYRAIDTFMHRAEFADEHGETSKRVHYRAIKVLSDDFRRNPESFRALAYEANRQLRLVHTNIVAVHHLGVDAATSDVYMVMEFLDGQSLADIIKDRKDASRGGFSFQEAWPIIRGLGEALQYAHDNELVHSDFKPGNCFLCRDGKVKVIDFGIARALPMHTQSANQSDAVDGQGERTVFSVKGAMTVPYASLEMREGLDPDRRDDVYALALVSYELLTMRHPFWHVDPEDPKQARMVKLGAVEARDLGLVPPAIKGLSTRQMRALRRGLAFERDARTPDVRTFLRELEGKVELWRDPRVLWPAAAVVLLGGGGALVSTLQSRALEAEIERQIDSEEATQFQAAIDQLLALDQADRSRLVENNRQGLTTHTAQRVDALLSQQEFDAAAEFLERADQLRIGGIVGQLQADVKQRRAESVSRVEKEIDECQIQKDCVSLQDAEGLGAKLTLLKKLQPSNPKLKPESVATVYARFIAEALAANQIESAESMLAAALAWSAKDRRLVALQEDLQSRKTTEQREAQMAALERRVAKSIQSELTRDALPTVLHDALELAAQRPTAAVLPQISSRVRTLVQAIVREHVQVGAWSDLTTLRDVIQPAAKSLNLTGSVQEIEKILADYTRRVDGLLAEMAAALEGGRLIKSAGAGNAQEVLQRMTAVMGEGAALEEQRALLLARLRSAVRRSIAKDEFAQATSLLEEASIVAGLAVPDPDLVTLKRELADAQENKDSADRQAQDAQRLAAASEEFEKALSDLRPSTASIRGALSLIEDVAELAPDHELVRNGRSRLQERVLEFSRSASTNKDFDGAFAALQAAKDAKLAPAAVLDNMVADIQTKRSEAESQLAAMELDKAKREVNRLIEEARFDPEWESRLSAAIKAVGRGGTDPDSWLDQINGRVALAYSGEIKKRIVATNFDPARDLLDAFERSPFASSLDPNDLTELRQNLQQGEAKWVEDQALAKLEENKARVRNLIEAGKLADARQIYAGLKSELDAGDPYIAQTQQAFTAAYLTRVESLGDKEPLNALVFLEEALQYAPGNADLIALGKPLQARAVSDAIGRFPALLGGDGNKLTELVVRLRKFAPEGAARLDADLQTALRVKLADLGANAPDECREVEALGKRLLPQSDFGGCPVSPPEPKWMPSVSAALDARKLTEADIALKTVPTAERALAAYAPLVRRVSDERARVDSLVKEVESLDGSGKDYEAEARLAEAQSLWVDRSDWPVITKKSAIDLDGPPGSGGGEPCETRFAGKGVRARAQCVDFIAADAPGPSLVVIPRGNGSSEFAMSRFEISVKDFRLYCKDGGACGEIGSNDSLPVSGVSLELVNGYLQWLSSKTGRRYRLPTPAEWEFAARANDPKAIVDANCTLVVSGTKMKGLSPLSVNSGKPNGWGLYNMVGNVQEWVQGGAARGGAYSDPIEMCTPMLEKPQPGGGEIRVTGFRVVRELG